MSHATFRILFELVLAINVAAAWTDDLDTKVGWTLHRLFANQMHPPFCKVQQVGPSHVMATEDGIHVAIEPAQLLVSNVVQQELSQNSIDIRMLWFRTRTHR